MKTFIYKLREYKIIESDTGEIRWETHFGLGAIQEGRCFIKGTILFIGPGENTERHGFLKGEFLDDLNHYPMWIKTLYFCMGVEVFHSDSGEMVNREEMSLWHFQGSKDKISLDIVEKDEKCSTDMAPESKEISYRLKRYEIIKTADNQILWKTPAGPYLGVNGTCDILEDILFIGSMHNEPFDIIKRDFLKYLDQLPKWNGTRYFCNKLSLHSCKVEPRIKEQRNEMKNRSPEGPLVLIKNPIDRCIANTEIKYIKPEVLEGITEIFKKSAKIVVVYAISLVLSIASFVFYFLSRLWKALKTRYIKKNRGGG